MTTEDTYLLKIAEFDLCRHSVSGALKTLKAGARHAGRSGQQILVLKSDMDDLIRRVAELDAIKRPQSR